MTRAMFLVVVTVLAAWPWAWAQEKEKGEFTLTEKEQRILDLTNAERKKKDLPPLKADPVLCEVARAHSANMAKQNKMAHELDGKTTYDRVKGAGYRFSWIAENLANGDVGVEEVMEAWMDSKVHRENILDTNFTEVGLGLAQDGQNVYYTEVFAKPRKQ
jgi:uncharacterized protein YkwD